MIYGVLKKVANALNEANIVWGVGASTLLSFYEIVKHPRDIDLIVSVEDNKRAVAILRSMASEIEIKEDLIYSNSFNQFEIDGIEVEIISGFTLNTGKFTYIYDFGEKNIERSMHVENVSIPLISLKDWFFLYTLMGDPKERCPLLEEYFVNNNYMGEEFEEYLNFDLSQWQHENITKLIFCLNEKRGC